MAKVAAMTREHDTRIWRVVEHPVLAARDQLDCSGDCQVGMDETSARKGQEDISIVADLEARRVVFATEGRSSETVERFAADLVEHGGDPATVTDTSSEVSTAFISGISQHLPNARMTFDRYHLAAKLSEAIDAVRRDEVATHPELTHTRWGVAQKLDQPLRGPTPPAAPADAPLRPAGHRPGPALARGLPGLL
jgi:transposase